MVQHKAEIDVARRRIVIRYEGPVTVANLFDLLDELIERPEWRPEFARMPVYDRGIFSTFAPQEMAELVDRATAYRRKHYVDPSPPVAHVCSDALKKVFVKHWLAEVGRTESAHDRLFDTEAEAHAWLDETLGLADAREAP
jgi:hypothetical protein